MTEELTFGKKLAAARKAARLTQAAVGEVLKVTPQAVSGWERDEALPEIDKLDQLVNLLHVDLMYLLRSADLKAHTDWLDQIKAQANNRPSKTFAPGDQPVSERNFPIYVATEAALEGGAGFMIIHSDVMEYITPPFDLQGVPDSYGVLIKGESMVPAFRPNDMVFVHPRRPIERDTDVILYDRDPRSGDAKSIIRHLVSFNDQYLKLERYNPPKTTNERRTDWPICHQIVQVYKGRR